jgi:hypothetical protein
MYEATGVIEMPFIVISSTDRSSEEYRTESDITMYGVMGVIEMSFIAIWRVPHGNLNSGKGIRNTPPNTTL